MASAGRWPTAPRTDATTNDCLCASSLHSTSTMPFAQRLEQFLDGVRGFAPDARWVRPESLHVTLKFIGEKPSEAVEDIKQALSSIRAGTIEISFRGYGFFPTSNAPRVFWIGIAAGPELAALARSVDETHGCARRSERSARLQSASHPGSSWRFRRASWA